MNSQSKTFELAMKEASIPYRVVGGQSIFDRREVKDLLGYIGCLLNTDDDAALLRIINLPPRGLGDTTIERALDYSRIHKLSLFKAISDDEFLETVSGKVRAAFTAFHELMDRFESRMLEPGANHAAVTSALLDDIGFWPELRRACKNEGEATAREINVRDMLRDLERYQQRQPDGGIRGFMDRVALDRDRQEKKKEEREEALPQVTLITLHAAKGLEFPTVFLVGVEEGLIPHERSRSEGTVDEERRLLYVGITRARKRLAMSYCVNRTKYGSTVSCAPSTFFKELARDHLEMVDLAKTLNAPATETSAKNHFARMREAASRVG